MLTDRVQRKTVRGAVRGIVLALVCTFLLSSCSFFDFFSVDSLIRPPKLTGENALIEQAFEAAVGKDIKLVSPVSGEYRSAFIQYDLDRDGAEETLVFYTRNEAPNEAHVHFLKYDGYRWYSAGDVTGNGSEVYSVSFYDLDRSNGEEIAVCWTVSDSKRNKTLALYKFSGADGFPDVMQLSVLQIYDYMVSDLDFDGQPEVLYLMDNSSDQGEPFKVSVIKLGIDDEAVHFVCELQLWPTVNLPLKMTYDIRGGRYRLYIDCVSFDGTYLTEILYFDLTSSILARVQNEEGAVLTELTFRSAETYCSDLNGDKIIDIPTEIISENYSYIIPEAEERSPMRLIRYVRCTDEGLQPLAYTYFYAPDGTFRFRMDDFLEKYAGAYDTASGELLFFAPDATDEPLCTVKCVSIANGEKELRVMITEPEVSKLTESYVLKFAEIL